MNLPIDKIIQGDTRTIFNTLPDNSINTIATSPPYWGLRDYGKQTNTVWGGNPDCEHEWDYKEGKKYCSKCGAWYGQLGLEPTLDLYIEHLLQITAELKRVLKPTGILFWNHGDCYGGSGGNNEQTKNASHNIPKTSLRLSGAAKCLRLQNYRLILRMIDEQGWILRNNIIWYKPNHMPSSAKDRFANAYEPVFMLTKNKKYYFDLDAVRVPHTWADKDKRSLLRRVEGKTGKITEGIYATNAVGYHPSGKNPGDLWTIPTQPFPEAHFATFPEKLVEPMIKAACPQWICKKCGKARMRLTEIKQLESRENKRNKKPREEMGNAMQEVPEKGWQTEHKTIGWTDCGCNAGWDAGVVLDPFAGSGTTCYVARSLGRHYIGIELNPEYVKMANKRLAKFGERLEKFVELEENDI